MPTVCVDMPHFFGAFDPDLRRDAIVALGLDRHGLTAELGALTRGLLDAAAHHGYRLPEVMAGYDRSELPEPAPYPHSCSPQAWAAATPPALLTARLRLRAQGVDQPAE